MDFEQHFRPGSVHSSLIEDLLELVANNRQDAVDAAIIMLEDLHEFGLLSRYVKKLHGLPLWELKTRSRGGVKGGVRVYFFVQENQANVINVDVKPGNSADTGKLKEALAFYLGD